MLVTFLNKHPNSVFLRTSDIQGAITLNLKHSKYISIPKNSEKPGKIACFKVAYLKTESKSWKCKTL